MPLGGGIEKLTEEIGSRLVERGHEVIVYLGKQFDPPPPVYRGMKMRVLPSFNSKALYKLGLSMMGTLDVLFREKVDIVHFHAIGPANFSFLTRLKGIPTVAQVHGLEWERDKWGLVGKSFFRLSNIPLRYFPDRVTVVSKVLRDFYKREFGFDTVYIPTGVNEVEKKTPRLMLEKGIRPGEYIFFAARLVEEKGCHFLIEAFNRIETDKQLVIAGDAAHAESYKAELKRLAGDNPNIHFLGFVHGELLEELFSNPYFYVLPSTLEGLPISLIEGMGFGNCVVASDIAENMEALADNGYSFRNRDVDDLARVLTFLCGSREAVEAKKEQARLHARSHYSWNRIADSMEEMYEGVLDARDPASGS